jgi:hypothetical protein
VYFVVDFALIGLLALENWQMTGDAGMFVALLFPLLSGVGLLTLNERAAQYRREAEAETAKAERKAATGNPATATRKAETAKPEARPFPALGGETRQRAADILAESPAISGADLGRALGKSERMGRMLASELRGNGNGNTK